ncbi:hypothetical protein ACHAW5_002508 [Stephanodiscus triporus]|uniref:tRNA uridine(34) hydroxylase N-terminal domain-containing protein n=1 Tax=Stephanodiscus triporus TaxID=2934178 RepID=A0ABD3R1G8_9STRA
MLEYIDDHKYIIMAEYDDDYDDERHMIALYYCYPPGNGIPIESLEEHASYHRDTCRKFGLGGRIRVCSEGINGVLSGREEDLRAYEADLRAELTRALVVARRDDDGDDDCGDPTAGWFDVRYCRLRHDVPREGQLFGDAIVRITREVVSLVGPTMSSSSSGAGVGGAGRRRRHRRRHRRRRRRGGGGEEEEGTAPPDGVGVVVPDGGDDDGGGDGDVVPDDDAGRGGPADDGRGRDDDDDDDDDVVVLPRLEGWESRTPATRLSPIEWNERLLRLSSSSYYSRGGRRGEPDDGDGGGGDDGRRSTSYEEGGGAVLLDARNVYETRVGHFAVPGLETVFPNTRKFSSLPMALNTEMAASALAGKEVYMYCTGECGAWKGKVPPRGIYQLHGGIQAYLEAYGVDPGGSSANSSMESGEDDANAVSVISENVDGGEGGSATTHQADDTRPCLYRGKNFVFDPRRTDPVVGDGIANDDGDSTAAGNGGRISHVGRCIMCSSPHDDYDNGHAPCEEREARCCRCRVLLLVCDGCRLRVRCWGEPQSGDDRKRDIFCGDAGAKCVDDGNVAESVEVTRY